MRPVTQVDNQPQVDNQHDQSNQEWRKIIFEEHLEHATRIIAGLSFLDNMGHDDKEWYKDISQHIPKHAYGIACGLALLHHPAEINREDIEWFKKFVPKHHEYAEEAEYVSHLLVRLHEVKASRQNIELIKSLLFNTPSVLKVIGYEKLFAQSFFEGLSIPKPPEEKESVLIPGNDAAEDSIISISSNFYGQQPQPTLGERPTSPISLEKIPQEMIEAKIAAVAEDARMPASAINPIASLSTARAPLSAQPPSMVLPPDNVVIPPSSLSISTYFGDELDDELRGNPDDFRGAAGRVEQIYLRDFFLPSPMDLQSLLQYTPFASTIGESLFSPRDPLSLSLQNHSGSSANSAEESKIEDIDQDTLQTSIPMAPSALPTDCVVFFTSCRTQKAFGHYAQAGTLAYHLHMDSGVPFSIVLTSYPDSIHRFDILYRGNSGNHHIYGVPVRVMPYTQLDTNFQIRGYVEVSWCRHSNNTVFNAVLKRTTKDTRVAFVSSAGYEAGNNVYGFDSIHEGPRATYPDLFKKNIAKNFCSGIGLDRDGFSFTPYLKLISKISAEELSFTALPESLTTSYNGYGLLYVANVNRENDINYLTQYFKLFAENSNNPIIVALGDSTLITTAIKEYCSEYHQTVSVINYSKSKAFDISFDNNGGNLKVTTRGFSGFSNSAEFDPTKYSQSQLIILICDSVPNLHLRRLLHHSSTFVAFTGVSSTIEALGEGRIAYYQYLDNNEVFVTSYLQAVKKYCMDNYPQIARDLIEYCRLSFDMKPLSEANEMRLNVYFKDKSLTRRMIQIHQAVVHQSSQKLSTQLLSWLNLKPAVEGQEEKKQKVTGVTLQRN